MTDSVEQAITAYPLHVDDIPLNAGTGDLVNFIQQVGKLISVKRSALNVLVCKHTVYMTPRETFFQISEGKGLSQWLET